MRMKSGKNILMASLTADRVGKSLGYGYVKPSERRRRSCAGSKSVQSLGGMVGRLTLLMQNGSGLCA